MRLGSKRMRIDFREFQRQRKAGVIVITLFTVAIALAFVALWDAMFIGKTYLEISGHSIPSHTAMERLLANSTKPVAVMFRSENCPVCKAMYPYWSLLEEKSSSLPVDFYDILYSSATAKAFLAYGVDETPTFIVFVDGKPVAKHVGAFTSKNITRAMLLWAQAAAGAGNLTGPALAEEGLEVFNKKCSLCHGVIPGLSGEEVRGWLRARSARNDSLAVAIATSIGENKTLVEHYGGWGGLRAAITSMRKYVDVEPGEADKISYMLVYIASVAGNRTPPEPPISLQTASQLLSGRGEATKLTTSQQGGGGSSVVLAVGVATALAAGVVAAFSPCTFPLLLAMVTSLARSGRSPGLRGCLTCFGAAIVGVLALGSLFLVASPVASLIQGLLLPIVAGAIIVAGAASLLGVPVELSGLVKTGRSLSGFCGAYGFLAVQCNLPLVVGALMLVLTAGDILQAASVLLGFAVGIAAPVSLTVYARGRLQAVFQKAAARTGLIERVGGGVMFAAGVVLLAYSLGLIAL